MEKEIIFIDVETLTDEEMAEQLLAVQDIEKEEGVDDGQAEEQK